LVTNVKKLFFILVVTALVLSVATPFMFQPVKATTDSILFVGPYDENTEEQFKYADGSNANCTVTVHLIEKSNGNAWNVTSFDLQYPNYSYTFHYAIALQPLYFEYTIIDNTISPSITYTRQYWFTTSDAGEGIFYVCFGVNQQSYAISFMDYTGLLKTYPYVEICHDVGEETNYVVEKYEVDMQGVITAHLKAGDRYSIYFQDGLSTNDKTYYYGDLVPSLTTGIQLVIRGIDFPKETLLLYQYVHTNAVRDFLNPTGAITVSYEDVTNQTTSVNVTITNSTSGLAEFSQVFSGAGNQTFTYTWAADNATSYQVTFTINHATYGTFYFKEYLLREHAKASTPLSLDFLGSDFPISTAVIIPSLLIIFVAGCFSELTSEAAAVLTVIVAILLTALGFIDIGQGALISALALAVMAGIVTARKRMQYG
jgi:hypothetical protein